MISFWTLAAALIALALLFVLAPLLRPNRSRNQDPEQNQLTLAVFHRQLRELDADLAGGELDSKQYQAARRDLERELLNDVGEADGEPPSDAKGDTKGGRRTAALLLAVLLPTVTISLYLYLGNSALIPRLEAIANPQAAAEHPGSNPDTPPLAVLIQRLADELERNPDNLDGWMTLGRTYLAIDRPQRALQALKQAHRLGPDNPDVLVAYAETIAVNHGSKLAGRPAELIRTALEIDPRHAGARWLEGLASFQAARYTQAAEQWEALRTTMDPASDEAAELAGHIAEARSRAQTGQEQAPQDRSRTVEAGNTEQSATPQPAAVTTIRVEVSLAEPLWLQADVNDSLFVYAKAVSGPPMPLAVYRAQVRDLPLTLTLDDDMAPVPTMKLSRFLQVTVGARISKQGLAEPRSGDLEGETGPVEPGQAGVVKVLIERVRP